MLLVVVGKYTVTIDGRPEHVGLGDAAIVEPGVDHSIAHHSDQPCRVVAVLASPDAQIG